MRLVPLVLLPFARETFEGLPGTTALTVLRDRAHFPLEEPGLSDLLGLVQAAIANTRDPDRSSDGIHRRARAASS